MNRRGFTLIELLIVMSIIGIIFSTAVPISYSMYQHYQASLESEKVLTLLSSARLEAFIYGEEKLITASEGRLFINEQQVEAPENVFVQIDSPLKFFRAGTTSGGLIKLYVNELSFTISIEAPFGGMTLRTS